MRRQRGTGLAAAIGLVVVLVVGQGAPVGARSAEPGVDDSYAGDGRLDLLTARTKLAVDGQDRLLVLEDVGPSGHTLRRFSPEGEPDDGFGAVVLPTGAAARSTITVLDDGTISILERGGDPGSPKAALVTVMHVSDAGGLDQAFGYQGISILDGVQIDEPVVQHGDGSLLVEGVSPAGQIVLQPYATDGTPAATSSVVCCGPDPAPQLMDLQPRGSGALALVRQRTDSFLVPIGADATAGTAVPLDIDGYAHALTALADGSVLVSARAGQSTFTDQRMYRYGADLALLPGPDPDGRLASIGPIVSSVAVGGRTLVLVDDGQSPRAYGLGSTGIDPSYGSGGSVALARPPDPEDATRLPTTGTAALADDGRLLLVGAFRWGPGLRNPFSQSASVVESFDPDGRSLHRWDLSGVAIGTGSLVAEHTAAGFLLRSDLGTVYVQRWVPPAADAVLGPVRSASVTVEQQTATVTWQPPTSTPGLLVERYRVRVFEAGDPTPVLEVDRSTTGADLALPEPATTYRVDIEPIAAGARVGPATSLLVIPPLPSVEAFVDRLSRDFSGRPATVAEQSAATAALASATSTPASLVRDAGRSEPWRGSIDPVVRLYVATFRRPPDPSGLRYWIAKRRAGVTVARISATFADSSEFRRTYGPLGTAAFVDLVYRNVLGRAPDPSGAVYWTRRLDARSTSRGQLMASFSESTEHVRRRAMLVDTVSLYWGMLHRLPDATEIQYWTASSPGRDAAALATALVTSGDYLASFD